MTTLWTDKHRPEATKDISGQGKPVAEALSFISNFSPGKALMLAGPAGSGKSSIPEAISREQDLSLIRLNASDKRTKGMVEEFTQTTKTRDLFGRGKLILIDELEGLSGGDRGAVPAIVKLIKQSHFPVFLITSDPYIPKLAPLRQLSKIVKLSKVPSPSIEKRLREICEKEGIKAETDALKALARFSSGDMRSAITDLQTSTHGRSALTTKELESIGYRDRSSNIFEILPKVFRSGSPQAAAKAMRESDKSPEELFLWIENNVQLEYSGESLQQAMETIAKADVFMSNIIRHRNYRFRRYMLDTLSGLAAIPKASGHYVKYSPPDKLIMMGRSRIKRAIRRSLCKKIGDATHTSSNRARRDYLPYLKIMLQKEKAIQGVELSAEEMGLLRA